MGRCGRTEEELEMKRKIVETVEPRRAEGDRWWKNRVKMPTRELRKGSSTASTNPVYQAMTRLPHTRPMDLQILLASSLTSPMTPRRFSERDGGATADISTI